MCALKKTFTYEGKRYYVTAQTEDALYEKLVRKKMELEQGICRITKNTLVRAWVEEWLETYKYPSVSSSWYRNIVSICNSTILPEIGSLKVKDVRAIHLQRVLNSRSGSSKSYSKKVFNILNEIFREAKRNEMIMNNPADNLVLPKAPSAKKRRSITPQERKHILAVCETHRGGLFFKIMLYCGLRPGEVAALQACNIDLVKKTIKVNASIKKDGTIGPPKSEAGNRMVPIPDVLIPSLEARLKEMDSPFAFVCTNTRGDRLKTDAIRKMWLSFKYRLNIEMGCKTFKGALVPPYRVADDLVPYCLRHTYCTDLQAAGVPINVARELMGHSDISITAQIYTHSSEESFNAASESINDLIKKRSIV